MAEPEKRPYKRDHCAAMSRRRAWSWQFTVKLAGILAPDWMDK
jgi:hypothetical protein